MLDRFIDKTSTRHVFQKNNTSGFKGVSRKKNRWLAQIWINNVIHRLGAYDTPEDAARAYDAAALKAWGTDCYLNFP
jgi:hypothetical protein